SYTVFSHLLPTTSFFECFAVLRDLHSFPTRRSSDLVAQRCRRGAAGERVAAADVVQAAGRGRQRAQQFADGVRPRAHDVFMAQEDRKSTRLNSSHDQISYAVFCLKKKTIIYIIIDYP